MNQMTTITSDDATRREIADRYGIALDLVPAVTVVPRGVSGLPMPWENQGNWKDRRDAKRRIESRIDRITAAKPSTPVSSRIADRRARAVELHDAGWYAHQIAEALGVAVTTAEDDLRKSGRKPHRMPYNYSRPEHLVRRDARIQAMHAAGQHIGMIAEAEGCDIKAARKMCRQAGISPLSAPRKVHTKDNRQARLRAERAATIRRMVADGDSREAIMAAAGITDSGVKIACRRMGLPLPPMTAGRAAAADAAKAARIAKVRALPSTMTYEQAGDALGVTRHKAAALAREAGVKFVRTYVRQPHIDAEMAARVDAAKRLWRSGMGFTAIQTELGLTVAMLRRALALAGIYKPTTKGKKK